MTNIHPARRASILCALHPLAANAQLDVLQVQGRLISAQESLAQAHLGSAIADLGLR